MTARGIDAVSNRIWPQLPPEVAERIVSKLNHNEVPCIIRLINKAAAAQFRGPKYAKVLLSRPCPPTEFAARWSRPRAMSSLTLKERRKLLCLTAASGVISNLETAYAWAGCSLTAEVMDAAVAAGELEACVWLREHGCPWHDWNMVTAARSGHLHICRWLKQQGLRFHHNSDLQSEALEGAAFNGHRPLCEWLLEEGGVDSVIVEYAAYKAARGGHVELMEWLLKKTGEGAIDSADFLSAAAEGCDLPTLQRLVERIPGERGNEVMGGALQSCTPDWREKLEWLLSRGFPVAGFAVVFASRQPDGPDRLSWLRDHGVTLRAKPDIAASGAAIRGHVGALRLLLDQGLPLERIPPIAAQHGHVEVMALLRERGYAVTPELLSCAVKGGHVAAVRWVMDALPPEAARDAQLMRQAATAGILKGDNLDPIHPPADPGCALETMALLRERGCPWGPDMFGCVAEGGSEEALEWLAASGCPMEGGSDCLRTACCAGNLAAAACLRRLGCEWDGAMFRYVARDAQVHVLGWMLEQGCPVADWDAAVAEARTPELQAWIREQRALRGVAVA